VLGVHSEALSEKYLGMPIDVGASTNGAFKYLKDRMWKKVQGWMEQILSAGGKEVLIKAVAQEVPTYSMSCFSLPIGLCQHMDSLLCSFWWGARLVRGRRVGYLGKKWEEMTKPKCMGGLGFRDIEPFNLALLARQAWRVLQEPTSLSARVLKAIYFESSDFLSAQLGSSPSRIWRAILDGRDVLKQGLIRRIGTGDDTKVWSMNWIPRDGLMQPVCYTSDTPPAMVSELINQTTKTWDMQALKRHLLPVDWEHVMRIPLMTRRQAGGKISGHGTMKKQGYSQFNQLIGCW
jgi:hypothetical protein